MREIIFDALAHDADLFDDFGIDEDHVFPNYAIDKTPRDNMFLIIRYEEQDLTNFAIGRGANILTIWAHRPKELGADMTMVRDLLEEVRVILLGLVGQTDSSWRMTDVRFTGYGGDLSDPGYNTFTKNAAFEVLCHRIG